MKVFVNLPEKEEDKKIFLDNLAKFKVELLLKSIENIKESEEIKEKVLEKIIEILEKKPKDSMI